MSQEKSNRNAIPWYFPPKNPPADIASSYRKDLRDYFIPLEQKSTIDLSSIQNGSSDDVPEETAISESPYVLGKDIESRTACETVDLTVRSYTNALCEREALEVTDVAVAGKRRKIQTPDDVDEEENSPNVALESESSPLSKKQRYNNVQRIEQENVNDNANVIPATRHKTKAFYKQVLPVEPQDLSVKQSPSYHHCSKGIKKYFVSKATAGLKSPRRASASTVEMAQKNENEVFERHQKIAPLKKRKSNVMVDKETPDDANNVYGFVDENMAIEARTTRLGKKSYVNKNENSALSKKSRSKRSSPRSKSLKVNKSDSFAKSNLRSRTKLKVDESPKSKAYSLRARNCSVPIAANNVTPPRDNVRRSSRLTTVSSLPSPPPLLPLSQESQDSLQNSQDNTTEASRALDSLYVTEVVDGDSLGSPIRLKFRRVGQKEVQSSDDMTDLTEAVDMMQTVNLTEVSCVVRPLPTPPFRPPPPTIHKRKHSKKKHKKHAKNTKLEQYRSIVKKAIGKPQSFTSKQRNLDRNESGLRSLRQSSILNRKAIEGAQKADQLKRKRWEQQRMYSPPKRSLRRTPGRMFMEEREDSEKEFEDMPNDSVSEIENSFNVAQTMNSDVEPETPKKSTLRSTKRNPVETKQEVKPETKQGAKLEAKQNSNDPISPSRPIRSVRLANSKNAESAEEQERADDIAPTKVLKKKGKPGPQPKKKLATDLVAKARGVSNLKTKRQTTILSSVSVTPSTRPMRQAKTAARMKTKEIELEKEAADDNIPEKEVADDGILVRRRTSPRKKDEKNANVVEVSAETEAMEKSKNVPNKPFVKKGPGRPRGKKMARNVPKKSAEEISGKSDEKNVMDVVEVDRPDDSKKTEQTVAQDVKLAPLFCKTKNKDGNNSLVKKEKDSKDDSAKKAEEAVSIKRKLTDSEREFLMSTTPVVPKKSDSIKPTNEMPCDDTFPKVMHVQQKDESCDLWNLKPTTLKLRDGLKEFSSSYDLAGKSFTPTTRSVSSSDKVFGSLKALPEDVIQKAIEDLTKESPEIDAKKMYEKYLSRKQASSEPPNEGSSQQESSMDSVDHHAKAYDLPWPEKYRPKEMADIIGNASSVSMLFSWLQKWKQEAEKLNEPKQTKTKTAKSSDSDSDFETELPKRQSHKEEEEKDEDEDDEMMCNTMLLTGSHGIGKTASVYALTQQLGFKVFEVNASSKRSGKQITSQLQEVTQSMQVAKVNEKGGISSFFNKVKEKPPDADKEDGKCQESLIVASTSLVLFEDIDLVFEEDEGFCNAVSNFMATSKRPIILTTNDANYSFSNKLKEDFEMLEFIPPPASEIVPNLRLICLSENEIVGRDDMECLVNHHECDIRKCLLALQFGIASGGWNRTGNSTSGCLQTQFGLKCIADFNDFTKLDDSMQMQVLGDYSNCQIDLVNANYLTFIKPPVVSKASEPNDGKSNTTEAKDSSKTVRKRLAALSQYFDGLSACDSLLETRLNCKLQSSGRVLKAGKSFEEVSDDLPCSWRHDSDIQSGINALSCCRVRSALVSCSQRESSAASDPSCARLRLESCTSEESRYLQKLNTVQEAIKTCGAMPLTCYFNEGAKAQDYIPTLRSICKSETERSKSNSKRSRRFLHYLDSISVELSSHHASMTSYFK